MTSSDQPLGAPQDPGAPSGPGGPQGPGFPDQGRQASGTAVIEREEQLEDTDAGDDERFAHYVRKDKIASSAVSGSPVVALCGKVWTPGRDPKKYPVCPQCKAIYDEMMGTGGDGGGKGSGGGRRWPFGRGRGGNGDSGSSGSGPEAHATGPAPRMSFGSGSGE